MAAPKGNKYALGNTGKPPKYPSSQALAKKVSEYFDYCKEEKEKITITGLALYLGFCARTSLDDYATKGDEYSHIIKRAKLAVENSYESHGNTIDIFALKNMGWIDKQEIDHTNNGNSFNTASDAELITRINKLLEARGKE